MDSETMEEKSDVPGYEEKDEIEYDVINDEILDNDSDSDECCICQDGVQLLQQGFLSGCQHIFHFECILTWSKVTNLCPLCKQSFSTVSRKNKDLQVIHSETIANTKQVFRPDPRDHDLAAQLQLVNDVRCEICGGSNDEHVLLMCDEIGCGIGSHTYCIGLGEVPNNAWYCSQHATVGPTRASDLIPRPASTLSSRRRTRVVANLMSNVLQGVGARMSHGRSRGQSSTSSARRRSRIRQHVPTINTLDYDRPTRRISLRMSRELRAVQQRADDMFARGDLMGSSLYAPSSSWTTDSRAANSVDQMWQDMEVSRQQATAIGLAQTTPRNIENNPNRISVSFEAEYRDLAKRMKDAVDHDNYASSVSLSIPKTARLRMVHQVKDFFGKLNDREKIAALESGSLELLFAWISPLEGQQHASNPLPQSQVVEGILTVLEELPVRCEDLAEIRGSTEVIDGVTSRAEFSFELRERAIKLSEKWRAVLPPVASNPVTLPRNVIQASVPIELGSSLPQISAFRGSSKKRKRSVSRTTAPSVLVSSQKSNSRKEIERWSVLAVDYVKGKLYPLYKQSKGTMSKETFKAIVKQVVARFRVDVQSMKSEIIAPATNELSSVVRSRLMKLLDEAYRMNKPTITKATVTSSTLSFQNESYSAHPSSSQL